AKVRLPWGTSSVWGSTNHVRRNYNRRWREQRSESMPVFASTFKMASHLRHLRSADQRTALTNRKNSMMVIPPNCSWKRTDHLLPWEKTTNRPDHPGDPTHA